MKKILFYINATAFILIVILFSGCTAEITTLPISVSLNQSSITLVPGESIKLTATVIPDDAAIKTVSWNSSDQSIATVEDGIVTAVSEGEASIYVITNSGRKEATCALTVTYPVKSVSLNRSSAILPMGKSLKLIATVSPEDAPDKSLIWKSDNPNIATVEDGVVTAKSLGTTNITATTVVGNRIANIRIMTLPADYGIITMDVLPYGSVTIQFTASSNTIGYLYVDWGDGSTYNSYNINTNLLPIIHDYPNINARTVSVSSNNLKGFYCRNITLNYRLNLTSLEVIDNVIQFLDCDYTNLRSLNVSSCTALIELSCLHNQLSSEALNALFNSLNDKPVSKIIRIGDNPGTYTCDTSIAEKKGWTVVAYN